MKLSQLGIAFSLISAHAAAAPLPLPKAHELLYPTHIRVRIAEAVPHVQVRGYGLRISGAGTSTETGAGEMGGWDLRCQSGRIRAVPSGGGPTLDLKEPVTVRAGGGTVVYRDRPYRETLQIQSVGSFCEVVNHVAIEKYLSGLVNAEFNSRWNEESIGAQIVAARTYALYQLMLARGEADRHYDVDATVNDQVYDGSIKEDLRAQRLVEKTRGWVLTVGNSSSPSPVKAFYHSTCGGVTELPEHVWGSSFAGFTHPVKCGYCGNSPVLNWQLELSSLDVIEAFRRALSSNAEPKPEWTRSWPRGWQQAFAAKRLIDVRAGQMDREGRVSEVITTWASFDPRSGRPVALDLRVSGARFREWVGPGKFRSAAFQVIAHGHDGWRFEGRGNGHGVGMCQWGAKTMGERGFKTAAILKHYYPDAILRKLW